MKKLFVLLLVLSLIGCSKEVNNISVKERLSNLSFEQNEDLYLREVLQDNEIYIEIISVNDKNFIRLLDFDIEKDVFVYNYEEDTFSYLYYIDDELTSKLVYSFAEQSMIQGDNELWEILEVEANLLKEYFLSILKSGNIDVTEM